MAAKLNMTAEERGAHERALARSRKQEERGRRRDARRPEPVVLDRAIADALRSYLSRDDRSLTRPLDPAALLRTVRDHLLLRNVKLERAGREPIVYDPQQVVDALKERLLTPVGSGRAA
ncbi:hypothetical protein NS228_23825 [Methylobacterium indicum]|uniref:hypothetical protein n=1 Tax=Methylobacterium indicum TaxID=1775910 RepID=UPI000734F8A7|nr:hypothetical protein [Methylobacterium indicum]KTS25894.1 hypothetical protein NS229_18870 [Methylobacterium indicum]KTS30703.1 hypothetical protein NS228_23825 [Methylobacterium indicum]KTS52513.1 hypothetical protein NS230_09450 [Methylobacterium indicum]